MGGGISGGLKAVWVSASTLHYAGIAWKTLARSEPAAPPPRSFRIYARWSYSSSWVAPNVRPSVCLDSCCHRGGNPKQPNMENQKTIVHLPGLNYPQYRHQYNPQGLNDVIWALFLHYHWAFSNNRLKCSPRVIIYVLYNYCSSSSSR